MKRFAFLLSILVLMDVSTSFAAATDVTDQLATELTKLQQGMRQINGTRDQCAEPTVWKTSDGTPLTTSDGSPVFAGDYNFERISARLGKIKSQKGEFDISIVDLNTAKQLFDEMARQSHIPFGYPEDGCYARAHEMTRLLENRGITAGKVFLEGSLRVETKNSPKGYVEWWYHVAPIILVERNGKLEPFVIDPSIFDRPVPAEEWFAIQTRHERGRRDRVYNTPRFQYQPSRGDSPELTKYLPLDLESTKRTMIEYLKIQKAREQRRKQGLPLSD